MKFTFKIGEKIKAAWPIYKIHFSTFLLLMLAMFAVNFLGNNKLHSYILMTISYILSIFLSYLWIRFAMSLVDGTDFNPFKKESFPTLTQFWNLFKTIILYGLCVLGGFILLVIPAFYVTGRLMFAIYLSIDKNQGGRATIKEAWRMTEGYGWTLFWKSFVIGLFMAVGFIALFVGSFITYPIGMMVMVMMYREFTKWRQENPVLSPVKDEVIN